MAYTVPTTRSTSTLITASIWNTDLVDNIVYLKSQVNAQIQLLGGAMYATQTSGATQGFFETTTNKNNFRVMTFTDSSGKEYAQIAHELPSDYDGGTVTAHFNWYCQNASTNSVVWGLQAVAYANDDALDAAFGTVQEVTDANLANGDLNKSAETSAITIAGSPAAGETVLWQVYRDSGNVSDDLAATAELISVSITYTRT